MKYATLNVKPTFGAALTLVGALLVAIYLGFVPGHEGLRDGVALMAVVSTPACLLVDALFRQAERDVTWPFVLGVALALLAVGAEAPHLTEVFFDRRHEPRWVFALWLVPAAGLVAAGSVSILRTKRLEGEDDKTWHSRMRWRVAWGIPLIFIAVVVAAVVFDFAASA